MDWESEEPPEWADQVSQAAWSKVHDGDRLIGWSLKMACPTCGHPNAIDIFHPATMIVSSFKDRIRFRSRHRPASQVTFDRPVFCQCQEFHTGRPPNGYGCGRRGDITFTVGE